jgi:S1-C subfamily serine protease
MRRVFSGRNVILLLAILFVAGLFMNRTPPPPKDPMRDAQQELLDAFGFQVELTPSRAGGLVVQKIIAGRRAEQVGLQVGDRILTVNERSVWHVKNMDDLVQASVSGGAIALLVERNGVYRQVWLLHPAQGGPSRAGG